MGLGSSWVLRRIPYTAVSEHLDSGPTSENSVAIHMGIIMLQYGLVKTL
jgi:hypothetical protein